jgi:hypothetical protein
LSFKATAVTTAIVTFVLGLGYFLAGPLIVGRWQLDPTAGVLLLGRRNGALYLGLSFMFFLARSVGPSTSRTALCSGTVLACFLLALTGLHALTTGLVGLGILISVAVELLLAAGFLRVLVIDRRSSSLG